MKSSFKVCQLLSSFFLLIYCDCIYFVAPKSQSKKIAITSSDRAAVYLELVDAHMEAGQLVNYDSCFDCYSDPHRTVNYA